MDIDIALVDPSLIMGYHEWLASSRHNAYIYGDIVNIYLRKAVHVLRPGEAIETLDIGSIDIDFRNQCKGIGTATINYIHCHHNRRATYIENILTKRFHKHLSGEGWITVDPTDFSPSVYKIVRD